MIEEHTEPAVSAAENDALQRALEVAASTPFTRAGGNPRVGCLLLEDDRIIAEGAHRGAGTQHAEVVALTAAGNRARGATAVVTLEPCAHHGRTGPCVEALLAAGIRRVVFGTVDPNSSASGGAARLRAAGVEVVGPVLSEADSMINSDWTFAHRTGRPRVRLKIASTLDGRVAAADGSSRWITSTAARTDAHQLRADHDAVLAGTGTVLADDPLLTVRQQRSAEQPLRVIFGTSTIPATAAIFGQPGESLQLKTRSAAEALVSLRGRGVTSVLIEGGPGVAATFLQERLVDEVISYVAPALLGAGPSATGDLGLRTIADALRGEITDVRSLGSGPDRCVRIVTNFAVQPTPDQEGRI